MDPPTDRLSRGELSTWIRFMVGSRALFQALDRRLRDESGLGFDDYAVLSTIQRASELSMSDLAEQVSFSPSRLSHVIQRMEGEGWVMRRVGCSDRRVKLLSLTDRGQQLFNEAWPRHADAVRELFLNHLEPADRRTMDATFTRIRKASRRRDA